MEGNINGIEIDQGISSLNTVKFLDRVEEIKRCPLCNSIYITDKECESCMYQLKYDRLGGIHGSGGFLELRDDYFDELFEIQKWFPIFERKRSLKLDRLMRKSLYRFKEIFSWLDRGDNLFQGGELVKLYLWELKEIVDFVSLYSSYWSKLENVFLELEKKQLPYFDEVFTHFNNKKKLRFFFDKINRNSLSYKISILLMILVLFGVINVLVLKNFPLILN